MAEHVGYIVKINELNPHSNADRLQIATIFGASVIVGLDVKVGDIGVFFPIDLQLSQEYCEKNNLVRKKDENGNNIGGYLEPDKRNIRAMKLRGEKSEGLYMPLESLAYTGVTKFEVGEKVDMVGGHEICRKYIPHGNHQSAAAGKKGNRARKHSVPIAPLFAEHADTEQLAYNLNAFKANDLIEITLKMHGTSGRTGYLPRFTGYTATNPFWAAVLKKDYEKLSKLGKKMYNYVVSKSIPTYDWGYVTGTRRVVLDNYDGGFYGDNAFREPHAKVFEGKLHKGETAYYEIVGFTTSGQPIMPSVSNKKISDKAFSKQYGDTTVFSYGCNPNPPPAMIDANAGKVVQEAVPQSDMYVYRMTMTNEDGDVVEYTPDYMRYRCEQMGVKCVPEFTKFILHDYDLEMDTRSPGEIVKDIAEKYYDGPDPVGKTHVREGVVIRIVNRPKFTAYKHKNFSFKVLEGLAKDLAAEPDMEEAQEEIDKEETEQ